jgi:hypothetical protein
VKLVQRHEADVPGSGGRVRVGVGDIVLGRMDLTVAFKDGTVLARRSVLKGDRVPFYVGGSRYEVAVADVEGALVGDDAALLEFTAVRSGKADIEALLKTIERSGLTFIRNDREHTAAEAADHMRRKLRAAKGRVGTAEQFIEHIATGSSMTGRPYLVRLESGETVELRDWLRAKLESPARDEGRGP